MRMLSRLKLLTLPLLAIGIAALTGLAVSNPTTSAAGTTYTAFAGNGSAGISVEAFLPPVININQGDSIQFDNPYPEPHTVTFLGGEKQPEFVLVTPSSQAGQPPAFAFNPKAVIPTPETGVASYDGSAFQNSGELFADDSWSVSFPEIGSYSFLCLLHPGMEGIVNVLSPGVWVPSQEARDAEAAALLKDYIAAGEASSAATKPGKSKNAAGTTAWEVLIPASVGQVDVMRFVAPRIKIGVGDTVLWKNDTLVPHTVTFAQGPPPSPEGGEQSLDIPAEVVLGVKPSQNYDGSDPFVNSGFIGKGPEAAAGPEFSLTFTKAGTYAYICILHIDQGMAGVIQVGGGGISPPSTGEAGLATGSSGGPSPAYIVLLLLLLAPLATAAVWRLRTR